VSRLPAGAGVRLLHAAGVSISRDTVLRAVMRQQLPFDLGREPVPRVLSVDDVAIRRGHRYATTAEHLRRPPHHRPTLADPYQDHLRRRLVEDPRVPVTHLLGEIRDLGYPESAKLSHASHRHHGRSKAGS
jgi:hypothetical protein